MRDITALHPDAQKKVVALLNACAKEGITIKIGECVRTTAEQDALYAKGRTAPGAIVTNCKGSSYSSMHQWGVAFDFFLSMDIDKDGSVTDDAFNDNTGVFERVGAVGKSLGLTWGGDFKSFKDRPHFQLPNWGSTATKLRNTYGTPDKFKATWVKTAPVVSSVPTVKPVSTTTSKGTLVERIQKCIGVDVDNIAGPKTKAACPTLQKGCRGTIVKLLQEFLGVEADGIFGKCTRTAVIAWQTAYSLVADGIVGKKTWAAIFESLK